MEDDKEAVAVSTEPQVEPTVNPQAETIATENVAPNKPKFSLKNPRTIFLALFLAFMLIGGGAVAYVTYVQKSPENLWKKALKNTADGIDGYLKNAETIDQSGFKMKGEFKVSSPLAVDGSLEGQWDGPNGSAKGDVGFSGVRINTEVRTIAADDNSTPDVYINVDGLQGLSGLLDSYLGEGAGAGITDSISGINGQWYFVDHTLLDQMTASSGSNSSLNLSPGERKLITDKFMIVLRDRMFSTAEDKAIFNIEQKYGKEDFEGTASYKMRVGLNKDNLKEFAVALKDAAKGTKLEEIILASETDKTIEEVLDIDELMKQIDSADFSKMHADVWVEAGGLYVRNVRLYPVEGKEDSNYIDLGLKYEGGDVFPFQIKATMDDDSQKGTFSLNLAVNKKNGDLSTSFNVDVTSDGNAITAEGSLSINATTDEVKVEKPENTKNLLELIGDFQYLFTGQTQSTDIDNLYNLPDYGLDDVEL